MPIATRLKVDGPQQKKKKQPLANCIFTLMVIGKHFTNFLYQFFEIEKRLAKRKQNPQKTKQKKASHGPQTTLLCANECDPSTEYEIYLFSHTKIIKCDH